MLHKRSLEELAVFGGQPLFADALHVNKPWTGDRGKFDGLLDSAWQRKWFTNDGPLSIDLEQRLADRLEVNNCVLTSSGTAALSILLLALGLKGEVILPSFTFVSTPHMLTMSGLELAFCDIDADDCNLSVVECEKRVGSQTAAIIPTHVFGRSCDIEGFTKIADQYGVPLIFDAAHAFGCSHGGQMVGAFGNAELFSFHATKSFHTTEGGAVTCSDPILARELRRVRNFGFVGLDNVEGLGINAKMSELAAAMGLVNLAAFDGCVAVNEEIYHCYRTSAAELGQLSIMEFESSEKRNYWYVSALMSEESTIARDLLVSILHAENVLARRYFNPGCHRMQPYAKLYPKAGSALPNTRSCCERVIVFPAGPGVSPDDVRAICELLAFVEDRALEIADRFDDSFRPTTVS